MEIKTLLFDIETTPNLAYVWAKYQQDVIAYKQEKELLCFAYKWLGEKKVKSFSAQELTQRQLVKKLHSLFDEADIVIAHNGDSFDVKNANAFFLHEKLKPPSPYKTYDTKKAAKAKFRFNSNKLDDLGEYLGLGRKINTGGFELWLGCMRNDPKAWEKMIQYNKQDIVLLEKVYLLLRPWTDTHPFVNTEPLSKCPVCSSDNIHNRGFTLARNFRTQKIQCQDCGKWFSGQRYKYDNKVV